MVRGNVGRPLVTLCMEIDKTSKELQRVEVGGWWWRSGGCIITLLDVALP